jgi:hypothetical protein
LPTTGRPTTRPDQSRGTGPGVGAVAPVGLVGLQDELAAAAGTVCSPEWNRRSPFSLPSQPAPRKRWKALKHAELAAASGFGCCSQNLLADSGHCDMSGAVPAGTLLARRDPAEAGRECMSDASRVGAAPPRLPQPPPHPPHPTPTSWLARRPHGSRAGGARCGARSRWELRCWKQRVTEAEATP